MSDAPEADFLGDVSSNGDGFFDVQFTEVDELPPPPAEPLDEPTVIGDGVCFVCGAPTFRPPGLTKGGQRRRVPKYCDLHAPNVQVPPLRPGTQRLESPALDRIQEALSDDLKLLGMLVGPMLPVTGMYVLDQADPFTIAVINLAKGNQRILRVLHRTAQVAPIFTVAQTMAGVGLSIQVDKKSADPHSKWAERLHVDEAYDKVYPNEHQANGPSFAPPPRYSTVP